MNRIDKLIAWFSPHTALKRSHARKILAAYEAGSSKHPNKDRQTDRLDPDSSLATAGYPMLLLARESQENYDILKGALETLAARMIGSGINTSPNISLSNGDPATELNKQIQKLYIDWFKKPLINSELSGGEVQRLMATTAFRDGEIFTHHINGTLAPHHSKIPYSLELLESEMLPWNQHPLKTDKSGQIKLGIERDKWKRPIYYYFHKTHPGSLQHYKTQTKAWKIPAADITHYYHSIRVNASRGISALHATFRRLSELRDYENSEMIAAKIAAALGFQIKRSPDMLNAEEWSKYSTLPNKNRKFKITPGILYDHLAPGESVEPINPNNRPNPGLNAFRKGHLHLAAKGLGFLSYSSFVGEYNGSYSAERLAQIEAWQNLYSLTEGFINCQWQPIYDRFIETLIAYRIIDIEKKYDGQSIDLNSLKNANHNTPTMPYIDPAKEAKAQSISLSNHLESWSNLMRKRGYNPETLKQEILHDKEFLDQLEEKK